jgi:hypothetical protein
LARSARRLFASCATAAVDAASIAVIATFQSPEGSLAM